ncbi:hypothetical protein ACFYXV_28335 [Streptomyces sp. NPDC002181]|uniref:hypothetical protein n=1 Tax=unclassified Streptomyces TaxID=2593676 RepID=UPI00365FB659
MKIRNLAGATALMPASSALMPGGAGAAQTAQSTCSGWTSFPGSTPPWVWVS